MPNVLSIVSYQFLPPKIGGQKGIAYFYRFFSKHANVTCVTTANNDISYADGYTTLPILSNSKFRYINLFYFFKLRKLIIQKNISHVIIEHPYYGWLGILLIKFTSAKLVVHSHNIESLRFKEMKKWWWRILWHYEKFTHRKASMSFFINDDDKGYALTNFALDAKKCVTITYGFELNNTPSIEDKLKAKEFISIKHAINAGEKILLFNGALDYAPNTQAVNAILEKINPLLLQTDLKYKIIICGKNLPAFFNELTGHKNIIYAGFVDDINVYFNGADIFINPVIEGGGIKTKLVEALGANLSAVSTQRGAIGVPVIITGNKMKIVADGDWQNFVDEVIATNTTLNTPEAFYQYFFWDNIAKKAGNAINE